MEQHEGTDPGSRVEPDAMGEHAGRATLGSWLLKNGPLLVVCAAAVYFLAARLNLVVVVLVAMGLGLVIFIHELGHFLVAKWCDVHVETFSIGFGPALPGCSFRWGETIYMVALFPLGGYVKMVGEGPDSEEADEDPRSFKNKPVWQRMAIISAGVTMNVLLGCACFVAAYRHGVRQAPAVVGQVDAGSAAWEQGVPSGAVIERIGSARRPYFEDLRPEVMLSWKGERLAFDYSVPGLGVSAAQIEPRREENATHPVIGVAPPPELKLLQDPTAPGEAPVLHDSAAARSNPPFRAGDEIVATTDPEHQNQVTALPQDPRNGQRDVPDYFEWNRRMRLLSGREVTLRVRRQADTPGQAQEVDVKVPAAHHYIFPGMRLRLGKVTSVRQGSPAAKAGVARGDILQKVELRTPGGQPKGSFNLEEVDPLRIPDELSLAADKMAGQKQVAITVLKPNEARASALPPVEWDDRWRFDIEVPSAPASPMAIPALGLAYEVETTVVDVRRDSSVYRAGLRKDDVIREIRFLSNPSKEADDKERWGAWRRLWTKHEGEEVYRPWWAHVDWLLQTAASYKEIQVRVKRDRAALDETITLKAEEDPTWPLDDRGLLLMPDWRVQKAEDLGEAIGMGLHKTSNFIKQVYGHLVSIATRRVSPEMLGGPITIARAAYTIAGSDFYEFLLFLGIISVNLAVINFLPIPVLDGGHIVFLLYEKLRGRPAPEQVRAAATYVGLALILCLMVFVLYLDVKKM